MSTLRGYWRGRRWAFLFLALCFAILALVIALYRLPLMPVCCARPWPWCGWPWIFASTAPATAV